MKFKIPRRKATFLHWNHRGEKHGQEKIPAGDLKVEFKGTKRDIDLMMPMESRKFSDLLYDKKGKLLAYYLSPVIVHRVPDTLMVTIYDKGERAPLRFKKASATSIKITLNDKHECIITMQLQLNPEIDGQLPRLARLLLRADDDQAELEVDAEQDDLFTGEDEGTAGNEEGGGDEAQQQLAARGNGDDDDDDEENY